MPPLLLRRSHPLPLLSGHIPVQLPPLRPKNHVFPISGSNIKAALDLEGMGTRAATSGGAPVGFYGELHPLPPHHHHQLTTSGRSLPLPPRATTTLPFPRPVAGPAPSPFRRRAGAPTARCWEFHPWTRRRTMGPAPSVVAVCPHVKAPRVVGLLVKIFVWVLEMPVVDWVML